MATEAEIAALLKTLTEAYPEKRPSQRTLQVYIDHLSELPLPLLTAAVREHIRSSAWFPKISELLDAAARLANTRHFETLPRGPKPDEIAAEAWTLVIDARRLENAFYTDGVIDIDAWEALAEAFTRMDRPHRAAYTREKLRRLLAMAGEAEGVIIQAEDPVELAAEAAGGDPENAAHT